MAADAFHTGPPAFLTLLPSMPGEEAVAPAFAEQVSRYCGDTVRVAALGTPGRGGAGRYVVRRAGKAPLFLKIFDERILELQRHSDRVAAHLDAHGIAVVRSLPNEPRTFAPGLCGELFPYLDARFCHPDRTELIELGAMLARTHLALASFEDRAAVESAGNEMHRRLVAAAEAIADGWQPHASLAAELRDAARGYLSGGVALRRSPQMVHGDCNYTNVLVERHNGRIYLIDFEESRAAWLAPMFDLAKVIERFVLVPSLSDAEGCAADLVAAYGEAGMAAPRGDLRSMLIASNDRALMIMADKARCGLPLPDAEWRKFVSLKSLAEQSAALLDRISATRLS